MVVSRSNQRRRKETSETEEKKKMQFVIPYWLQGAKGDELRWAIRSIHQNFVGGVSILLIGDRPDWYTGKIILRPKIEEEKNHNCQDVLQKMRDVSTNPLVENEFFFWMDDIYLINPADRGGLCIPRVQHTSCDGSRRRKKHERLKKNTFKILEQRGYTSHDYATHLPHLIEKDLLKKLFDDFPLISESMLWEVVYGNVYRSNPFMASPFLHTQSSPVTRLCAETAQKNSVVLNHGNKKGWTPEFRSWLEERFPQPSPDEV